MSEIDKDTKTIPFYPDHVKSEAKVVVGILILVMLAGIIGSRFPLGLQAPADPLDTPAHVKPEWYFLALYQILKYIPAWFTMDKVVGLLLIIVGVVAFWPFIDNKPESSKKVQRNRLILVAIGMIIFAIMTIIGEVS